MSVKETIAPCFLCREVCPCRPYGPDERLVCIGCARALNEAAVQAELVDLNDMISTKTSPSVH